MGTTSHTNSPVLEWDHLPEEYDPHAFVPRRPIGLAVVCALLAFGSVVLILAAVFFFLGTYVASWIPAGALPNSITILGGLSPVSAGILLTFGGAMIGVATALWRQEPWALYTVFVVLIGAMVYLLATGTITVLLVVLFGLFLYLVAVRNYFY